ncbi:MAG: hypothetical protein ACYDDV_11865 [Methanoregula sp.]
MTNMYRDPNPPRISAEMERALSKARIISVLCVHDNPVFLGRVCRHLEQRGDLSVDISVSGEDAVHLMIYVPFEVIVADYPPGQDELGFIKAIRARENAVPFIYFIRTRNAEVEVEARRYGAVYFIEWGEESLSRGFEKLYLTVKQAATEYRT